MSHMTRGIACAVGTVLMLGFLGCGAAEEADQEHGATLQWGYEGDEGPEHWAELSDDFALCANGTMQSPIDLGEAVPMAAGTPRRAPRVAAACARKAWRCLSGQSRTPALAA